MATALTGVEFGGIMTEFTAAIPLVLPTVISFIGLRKGLGFVMSALKRA